MPPQFPMLFVVDSLTTSPVNLFFTVTVTPGTGVFVTKFITVPVSPTLVVEGRRTTGFVTRIAVRTNGGGRTVTTLALLTILPVRRDPERREEETRRMICGGVQAGQASLASRMRRSLCASLRLAALLIFPLIAFSLRDEMPIVFLTLFHPDFSDLFSEETARVNAAGTVILLRFMYLISL